MFCFSFFTFGMWLNKWMREGRKFGGGGHPSLVRCLFFNLTPGRPPWAAICLRKTSLLHHHAPCPSTPICLALSLCPFFCLSLLIKPRLHSQHQWVCIENVHKYNKVPAYILQNYSQDLNGTKKIQNQSTAKSIKPSPAGITWDLFSSIVWLVNNYVTHS